MSDEAPASPQTPASESDVQFATIYNTESNTESESPTEFVENPLSSIPLVAVDPVAVDPVVIPPPPSEALPILPKIAFIIPYRDREAHLSIFTKQMEYVLEDIPKTDYVMFLIHQADTRSFNRGAIKNIGFLYVRNKYPEHYKNMTLVFHDVDTMLKVKNQHDFSTVPGVIRHFCGFNFTLGGIVCIHATDFERIGGFPNFWAWGYEDNMIQTRASTHGIHIDRSRFVDFTTIKDYANHPTIISLSSGITRVVNRNEYQRFMNKTREGYHSIQVIQTPPNPSSMVIAPLRDTTLPIEPLHVVYFFTGVEENAMGRKEHDLRKGSTPFGKILNRRGGSLPTMGMHL